ncbi:MAG: class I SAM-dependent methyltransferase [Rhodospirillaceae bacterium]|nr:class I SAM-dependent methyltransferase [Rhodospirillaceae bacterium]MBL6941121.1 class I SAM-dependent methyltransferase [Rhodospirillales bacterium]
MSKEQSRQSWNPEDYERNAGFVSDLGAGAVDLLAPKAGERILDLGCGHGKLTEKLVAMGADVVAIDASAEQVEGARARGLDAHVMNASALAFENQFDAVFSNAVLHWIKDPGSVIEGVKRALIPGGRFVGEFGGAGNVARVALGVERVMEKRGLAIADYWPWYFPSVENYGGHLQAAGLTLGHMELFARPTPLPGDIIGWLETFGESFITAIPKAEQKTFLQDVRDDLAPDLKDDQGVWSVDYVRLRFQAFLP